jgi:hypothetical protein
MKTTTPPLPELSLAQRIYDERFNSGGGTARSAAYMAGVLGGLRARTGETERAGPCPYAPATAEMDAWYSGLDHSKLMLRMDELSQRDKARKEGA